MAVLAGRVAVVTGASAAIGAGLAAMLAAEDATVVLAARRETELAVVAAGPVDVLVNNAGRGASPAGNAPDISWDGGYRAMPALTRRGLTARVSSNPACQHPSGAVE